MVGDTYNQFDVAVGVGFFSEIKPSAGTELIIHNVYHADSVGLRLVDGSGNESNFYEEAGKGLMTNMYFHLTNTQYLRIYNIASGAQNIAVDGIVSKEP